MILVIRQTKKTNFKLSKFLKDNQNTFKKIYYIKLYKNADFSVFLSQNFLHKLNILDISNYATYNRFDNFMLFWKELSKVSDHSSFLIIRQDIYISNNDFLLLLYSSSQVCLVKNYSLPYFHFLRRFFLKYHILDGLIFFKKNIFKCLYNEICNIIRVNSKLFKKQNYFNTPKVHKYGLSPEAHISLSLISLDIAFDKIYLNDIEWSIKKWSFLDFIFRYPFFSIKR